MREERRSYTRIRLELPANLYLLEGEFSHRGETLDLSLGGCFLPMREKLPVGEVCEIHLTMGEGLKAETLRLTGRIARNADRGVGIEFTGSRQDRIDQLQGLLT